MSTSPDSVGGGATRVPRSERLYVALCAFAHGPWFAYGMLALLQLRAVWGIWRFRDLTPGDTSSYFLYASQWFEAGAGEHPLVPAVHDALRFADVGEP